MNFLRLLYNSGADTRDWESILTRQLAVTDLNRLDRFVPRAPLEQTGPQHLKGPTGWTVKRDYPFAVCREG